MSDHVDGLKVSAFIDGAAAGGRTHTTDRRQTCSIQTAIHF